MQPASAWDWSPGKRDIWDIEKGHSKEAQWHEELYASPDGERTASVACYGEEGFGFCINGQAEETLYEKIWYPRFSPDGRLTALVMEDDEWKVYAGGEAWPDGYGFLWQTMFSQKGDVIAAAVQQDMEYGMVVNGEIWENLYENANNFALSSDGSKSAAVVQTRSFPQADIFTYQDGCYTVAVNGEAWDTNYVSCYTPTFNADGGKVAAQVRTTLYDYSIVVDNEKWSQNYQCVWEPRFNPADGSVIAPVRIGGKWGMAQNGELIWPNKFYQCWHQKISADGKNIFAIVAPKYGKWTVARNASPWSPKFGDMVRDLVISPDGRHAAAVGKTDGKYAVVADNLQWVGWYEMIWIPVFSPDSQHVAAKVELANGKFTMVMDGHAYHESFDQLWDPVFSPEGTKIMLRAVKDGKYCRIIVPVNEF